MRKLIIGIIALAAIALTSCKSNAQDYSSLYERNIESIYSIESDQGHGTAWQLGPNVIVTASHVVHNEDGALATSLTISGNDLIHEKWPVDVLYDDPSRDIAILSMKPEIWEKFKAAENPFSLQLAKLGSNRTGDPVWAIGNRAGQYGYLYTGYLAATQQWMFKIQHAVIEFINVAIIPGDSGGPLFNAQGEVIGSAATYHWFEDGQTNNGQAVSVDSIWKVLYDIKTMQETGEVSVNYIELKSFGSRLTEDNKYQINGVDPENRLFKDIELQDGDYDIVLKSGWTDAISSKPFLVQAPTDIMLFVSMLIPNEEVIVSLTRKNGEKFSKKLKISY